MAKNFREKTEVVINDRETIEGPTSVTIVKENCDKMISKTITLRPIGTTLACTERMFQWNRDFDNYELSMEGDVIYE